MVRIPLPSASLELEDVLVALQITVCNTLARSSISDRPTCRQRSSRCSGGVGTTSW